MKFDRGYTGHENLEMFGLINMNARMYNPALGRFLSADPYVQIPDFSQTYNRYSYANNNPMIYTDPSGEVAWFVIPLVMAAVSGTANVVANWKDIDGFWQGVASFGVGASAGFSIAATGGAGAGFWAMAGVAAAGGAATGATNNVVAQTGTNFSGFNNIDWGQVGVSGAVGGAAGFAGSAAGAWAANTDWMVNGISSPLAKAVIVSPLAAGAGHVAGGTTANLFAGQSLDNAFANSFKGIGKSMAIGGAIGVGTTAGMLYASGINPLTGNALATKGGTTVYRAVNAAEKASIDSSKSFLLKEGGTEVKYFAKSLEDAYSYGKLLYPNGYSVVQGTVNPALNIGTYWYPFVDGMGAYAFPGSVLPYITPIFP
jgi:RHS repeat-associated protein